jgi:putative DNA primase/helicase
LPLLESGSLDVETLLTAVMSFNRRFVVLSPSQNIACALWLAHCYAIAATDTTPYLHVTSAVEESGKSRLLEVLELLAPEPKLRTSGSVTVALIFRAIATLRPVVFIDEADNVLADRKAAGQLLGVLNAGYRRGEKVHRVGGAQHERLDEFEVFAPKAIAGIDNLPPTLASRCIRIEMRRRKKTELIDDFFRSELESEAQELRDALAAFADRYTDGLRMARPERLGVRDRLEEGLRLPLAIAALAGFAFDALAREAFRELAGVSAEGVENVRITLLQDIFTVFTPEQELATAELLRRLFSVETSPWRDWWGSTPNARLGAAMKLARTLRPLGIASKDIGPVNARRKGYRIRDFQDAFSRYLPVAAAAADPAQAAQVDALSGDGSDGSCATCAASGNRTDGAPDGNVDLEPEGSPFAGELLGARKLCRDLVRAGLSSAEIAAETGLSESTVSRAMTDER